MTVLPRIQLGEIEDQPWLPAWFRGAVVNALGVVMHTCGLYERAFEELARFTDGADEVLDLASGSGRHLEEFLRWSPPGTPVPAAPVPAAPVPAAVPAGPRFFLSDLHPGRAQLKRVAARHAARLDVVARPVNAADVGPTPGQRRVMFAAFHHLRDDAARAALLDAARHADGIFVYEPQTRNVLNLVANLVGLALGVVAALVVRPVRLRVVALSTLLPLVPLVLVLDGILSVLRTRTPAELRALVASLPENDFEWEIKVLRGRSVLRLHAAVLLVGRRRARPTRAAAHVARAA